jgi:FAD dependent oxidoreductase TIGR03364
MVGADRWLEFAGRAAFHADRCGSLSLAYREEACAVLSAFAQMPEAEDFEWLDPAAVKSRFPAANPDGLKGALYSPYEICVRSSEALAALTRYAATLGVRFEFGVCANKVHDDAVEVADGRLFPFEHCVVAAGSEIRLLFPQAITAANVQPCQLQMMRTESIAERLGAIFVSDLTLAHYPAFSACPGIGELRDALGRELSEYQRYGIHVIAAQHQDGSLTLGDSHEYALDFAPDHWIHIDDLVLRYLQTFLRIPGLRVASRWQGVYLKSTVGELQVVRHPRERVTLVTAMGGLGMTLSWGLAARTIAGWSTL